MASTSPIEPGEFFVLLGPSGSGKTTTLRILAGLETVSAGRVLMDGADVTTLEPGERDVAMVFQSYALYPHMTVAQNIGFPLKMVGTPVAEIERAVADAAAKVEIGHLLQRTPGQLSGGQQQRCALARAIVRQPRLFLLDEPLSNLDAKLRLETRLGLHKLQRSLGATDRLRHARSGRGDDPGRSHRGLHGRPHRPGRHAARDLLDAADGRGRRLHRHAADEPAARHLAGRRCHRVRAAACRWPARPRRRRPR
jgi:ABC-type lipoprotein export system ATPase subunit